MTPLGRTIARWITDHGYESANQTLREAVREHKINPETDISIRGLAEGMLGEDWVGKVKAYKDNPYRARESADAVDASVFASITGNLLIDTIREKYKNPEFIGDSITTKIPITNGNLESIIEPYLSDVATPGDDAIIQPGMPYPSATFGPNYISLVKPVKYGLRCDVTWESIYADRTRQIIESAQSIGKAIGRAKEYRILKCLLGLTNNYTFSRDGGAATTYATYQETLVTGRWVNHLDSQTLNNWEDLNAVQQLFNEMRDPVTGEPIEIDANTLVVMPQLLMTANHILHSTQIRRGDGGVADATATYAPSGVKQYNVLTSKYLYKLASTQASGAWTQQDNSTTQSVTAAQAAQMWFVGDLPKAFYYREVYPLEVIQAPPLNPLDFDKDIVLSVKAREYGAAGVRDPRYVVRCTNFNFMTATT